MVSAEMELLVYENLPAENEKEEMKILKKKSIELLEELGKGTYGSVCLGKYKYQMRNNKSVKEVFVAVKLLKGEIAVSAQVWRVFF